MFQKFVRNLFFRKNENPAVPLRFTAAAEEAIRKHLDQRKESVFRIVVDRTEGWTDVKIGYDRNRNSDPLYEYPIPLEIDPEDEVSLEGARIDWEAATGEFRIYPDVDLDVEYQPIRNRFRIDTNRRLFDDLDRRRFQAENGYPEWMPKAVDPSKIGTLEIRGSVWILFLNGAYRSNYSDILILEKEIADSVLDFFSAFPKRIK